MLIWLMFTPEDIKDCSLDCLKTLPVMSQTSDRQRERTSGLMVQLPQITEKQKEERESQMERERERER